VAVFPIFYTGSIGYYQALLHAENVEFEVHEHFVKQTQRNRCEILGPNGRQLLVIPTQKKTERRLTGNTEMSYAENWQKQHWKSLEAAYRRSPYFEYYEHEFFPYYQSETKLLVEFNLNLLKTILKLLKVNLSYTLTEAYKVAPKDYRESQFPLSKDISYMQVFNDRHSFESNLSVLDALFNLGPKATDLLRI
jgi:outer membrane phospholipase A